MIRNTAAATTFAVAPARRRLDTVEVQGTAAAAEVAADILLSGQDVTVYEITAVRGCSYYNPRVRRIHRDAARLAMSRAAGTPAEDGVDAAGRVGTNGVTIGWTFPDPSRFRAYTYSVVSANDAVRIGYPTAEAAAAAITPEAAEESTVSDVHTNSKREAATAIQFPAAVKAICIETWDVEGGQEGIIWDRTGQEDQDGEWGTQIIDWAGDVDDVVIAARNAGFAVEEFNSYDIGGDQGATALARRAAR